MRKLKAPEWHFGDIVVPGDWIIEVPTVRPDRASMERAKQAGASEVKFLEATQEAYERGIKSSIRLFIRYWAREYRKMHPTRHDKQTGQLDGFNPADFIHLWVPGKKAYYGYTNTELRQRLASTFSMRGH